jgi:hypothetical protein
LKEKLEKLACLEQCLAAHLRSKRFNSPACPDGHRKPPLEAFSRETCGHARASRHPVRTGFAMGADPTTAPGIYWIPALASLRSLGRNDGE